MCVTLKQYWLAHIISSMCPAARRYFLLWAVWHSVCVCFFCDSCSDCCFCGFRFSRCCRHFLCSLCRVDQSDCGFSNASFALNTSTLTIASDFLLADGEYEMTLSVRRVGDELWSADSVIVFVSHEPLPQVSWELSCDTNFDFVVFFASPLKKIKSTLQDDIKAMGYGPLHQWLIFVTSVHVFPNANWWSSEHHWDVQYDCICLQRARFAVPCHAPTLNVLYAFTTSIYLFWCV